MAVVAKPAAARRLTFARGLELKLLPAKDAPDAADLTATRKWVAAQTRPTAIDLFCGAGGLSYGLRSAGFSVLVGADNDGLALKTHVANIGGLGYSGDLSDAPKFIAQLRTWGIRHVDVIAAGLPCQPFSRAGRSKIRSLVREGSRRAEDPRAKMWQSFISIVRATTPEAVLIENVPDLAVWQEGALLMELWEQLRGLGYRTQTRVLSAWQFGVPQHRRRLFIVGLSDGVSFTWPEVVPGQVSLNDAIGDLPRARAAQRKEVLPYRPLPGRTAFQREMRRSVRRSERKLVHDHITRGIRPDDKIAFQRLKEGGVYDDLPPELKRYRSDIFRDKYKRLVAKDLSRTITAHLEKDGYWYIHPTQTRTLSVREAARIQTFPDSFRFAGTPTSRYRQIGNAVPPKLAEAVGSELLAALSPENRARAIPKSNDDAFQQRLVTWYRKNGRDYPWRQTGLTSWMVLVAEVCLRRTRADQVEPVYLKLARIAPTPEALLKRVSEVRGAMKSLGLSWRAENLVALARHIVTKRAGEIPRTETDLKKLPGVGEYVARAVLSFALDRPAVILDTNTRRIVDRVHGRDSSHAWESRVDLYELAGAKGPNAEFNYALLDFGALVCKARAPLCGECPVRDLCKYRGKAA